MAAAGMAATGPGAKPASSARVTKLALYLLHRMRVTTRDGRQLVGGLIGFDKHLNLVLKDCEEFKHLPKKGGGASPPDPAIHTLSPSCEVVRLTPAAQPVPL